MLEASKSAVNLEVKTGVPGFVLQSLEGSNDVTVNPCTD